MKGVSGSGKSFRAKELAGDPAKVFSTDAWFDRREGGYRANWSPDKLHVAHTWNQDRVKKAILDGITPIVVDNTNLKIKFARIYYDMAIAAGYEVRIEESQSPWWIEIKELLKDVKLNELELKKWAGKMAYGFNFDDKFIVNEHGVPADTIYNMLMQYSNYKVEDFSK